VVAMKRGPLYRGWMRDGVGHKTSARHLDHTIWVSKVLKFRFESIVTTIVCC
jgi:hypothetical protein